MMPFVLFVTGLLFLIVGAEALVRGASRLAIGFGVSPLVIGLTVVAFGTSSPELAVSIKAALTDQASVAVGNVVGSNIFNVLFILGLSALIVPLAVSRQLLRLDVPLMVVVSVLVLLFSLDEKFSRIDGLILFAGLIIYTAFLIYQSRKENSAITKDDVKEPGLPSRSNQDKLKDALFVVGGLILLVAGSQWLVDGAIFFAQHLGVSEMVIGLTIVAAGTSLPEVVTSVIAALRGQRDIAVGNVVGSNLFNLMGVMGLASIIAPSGIDVSLTVSRFDIPFMIAVAFACLPIFFTGGIISRKEGALFLGYYVLYTVYLILSATNHAALPAMSATMLYFVIPLTLFTIMTVFLQELRKNGAH